MSAFRSLVLVVLSFAGFDPVAAAQPSCPADAVDCVTEPATFSASAGASSNLDVDTGWFPADSPVQLRARVRVEGSTNVTLAGDAIASWPEPIVVGLRGSPDAGSFRFAHGITIEVWLRIGVTVLGRRIGGEWAIPIPFLPADLAFVASRTLSDFALDGDDSHPTTLIDSIAPITVLKYDALQSIIPISGLSGALSLEAQGSLESTYRTDRILVGEGEPIIRSGDTTLIGPTDDGDFGPNLAVGARPEGRLEQTFVITLRPHLHISLLGVANYDVDIASLPIALPSQQRTLVFPESPLDFALPDIELVERRVAFDRVAIGESRTRTIAVRNTGLRALVIEFDELSPGFSVPVATRTIPPSSSALLTVAFRPTDEGPVTGTLVLLTNDPDRPEIAVALEGEGFAPIPPPMVGDGGIAPTDDGGTAHAYSGGGCSCDVATSESPRTGTTAFAVGLGVLVLTRAGRRRPRLR